MKNRKNLIKRASLFVGLMFLLCVFACSATPDSAITAKYTEQTALAIIDGAWKISAAIVSLSVWFHEI